MSENTSNSSARYNVSTKSELDKNSIFFDVYVNGKFSKLNNKILFLRDEINIGNKHDKDKLRKLVHKFVANLYISELYGGKWVVLPRGKGNYSSKKRLAKLHMDYDKTIFTINRLNELEYIESKSGLYNREHPELSFCHRMKATEKLKHMFYGISISDIYLEQGFETILKRNGEELVLYKESRMVKDMRNQVHTLNKMLEAADICLSMTPEELNELNIRRSLEGKPWIFTFRKYLTRVFCRNTWNTGGRLYGGFWQNIPKKLRHLITINNEETVELDFDCLHPQLLYAQETGKLYDGDIYSLGGYPKGSVMRDITKYALLVMVNAKDEDSCEFKINDAISEARKNRPEEMATFQNLSAEIVMKKIFEAHPSLKGCLCSDVGVELQYKDSKIALSILLKLAREGIVALPVHDSFIVQARHEGRLRQVMIDEFVKIIGDTPSISKKEKPSLGQDHDQESPISKAFEAAHAEMNESNDGL